MPTALGLLSTMHDFGLAERLAQQQAAQLYRRTVRLDSPQGTSIRLHNRHYLSFASNDYLGLANHPSVIAALQEGAATWGVGSGAAHLVTGHLQPHQQLEEALAQWTGRERALLFSSGYQANLAVISALLSRSDTLLQDRLNHASLLDAGLLSGARFWRYQHNDMHSLKSRLARARGNTLIATDGVFSMDGDLALLPEICLQAQQLGAWVMVDDAHGLGVLGNTGAGTLEHFNLNCEQIPVLMGTLGKALGTSGAFIAGSDELIQALMQFARPYIYSTSTSPAIACASLASLRIVQEESWRREHLQQLITYFRQGAQALGLELMPSSTAIQPLLIGDSAQAMQLAQQLQQRGIWITAIRPPTVPKDSARLRITLSAAHTKVHIEQLLDALAQVLT